MPPQSSRFCVFASVFGVIYVVLQITGDVFAIELASADVNSIRALLEEVTGFFASRFSERSRERVVGGHSGHSLLLQCRLEEVPLDPGTASISAMCHWTHHRHFHCLRPSQISEASLASDRSEAAGIHPDSACPDAHYSRLHRCFHDDSGRGSVAATEIGRSVKESEEFAQRSFKWQSQFGQRTHYAMPP